MGSWVEVVIAIGSAVGRKGRRGSAAVEGHKFGAEGPEVAVGCACMNVSDRGRDSGTHLEDGRIDNVHEEHRLEQRVRQLGFARQQLSRLIRLGRDECLNRMQASARLLHLDHAMPSCHPPSYQT